MEEDTAPKMEEHAKDESSSSEDEGMETEMPDYEAEISQCEAAIQANQYDYESHIHLISALKNSGELDRLREARDRLALIYPLPTKTWLEWIEDEKSLAPSDEQDEESKSEYRERMISMFERGIKDFSTVELWMEYGQWLVGSGLPHAKIRETFERAITAVGLHVGNGAMMWDMYRIYESTVYSLYKSQLAGYPEDPKAKEDMEKQVEFLLKQAERQFSLPLNGMKESLEDCVELLVEIGSEQRVEGIRRRFEQAQKKLQALMQQEIALEEAKEKDPGALKAYQDYIDCEKKAGDPARIQMSFERMIADNYKNPKAWLLYLNWLDTTLRIPTVVIPVYTRATRNCYSSTDIWVRYFWALERFELDEELDKTFELAASCGYSTAVEGVQLFLNKVYAIKRRIDRRIAKSDAPSEESGTTNGTGQKRTEKYDAVDKAFSGGADSLQEWCGEYGWDPEATYRKAWAHFLASKLDSLGRARELWKQIMAGKTAGGPNGVKNATFANMWLDYVNLEKNFGKDQYWVERCRKLLIQGVNSVTDDPQVICNALIQFEREEGTFATFESAVHRVEVRLSQIAARKTPSTVKRQDTPHPSRSQSKRGNQKSDLKQEKVTRFKLDSSDLSTGEDSFDSHAAASPFKAKPQRKRKADFVVFAGDEKTGTEEDESPAPKKDREGFAIPVLPPSSGGKRKPSPGPNQDSPSRPIDVSMDDSGVSDTPERHPPVKNDLEAELAKLTSEEKHSSGDLVQQQTDQQQRVIDTSRYDRTVFVSNLAFSTGEDRLRVFFQPIGKVTDVRVIQDKNIKGKRFGYVEFATAQPISDALKLDRTPLDGRPIFIKPAEDRTKSRKTAGFAGLGHKAELDNKKLFVRHIPKTMTQKEIQELFEIYGTVSDVRIATLRNGQSKGIAYIDFETEEGARQALLKMDGTTVNDCKIAVEISNPPARKQPGAPVVSQRSTSNMDTNLSKRKPAMFAPRTVTKLSGGNLVTRPQVKKETTAGSENKNGAEGGSVSGSAQSAKLTNAEFRAKFLK